MNMAMHNKLFDKITQGYTSVENPVIGFPLQVTKFWIDPLVFQISRPRTICQVEDLIEVPFVEWTEIKYACNDA